MHNNTKQMEVSDTPNIGLDRNCTKYHNVELSTFTNVMGAETNSRHKRKILVINEK